MPTIMMRNGNNCSMYTILRRHRHWPRRFILRFRVQAASLLRLKLFTLVFFISFHPIRHRHCCTCRRKLSHILPVSSQELDYSSGIPFHGYDTPLGSALLHSYQTEEKVCRRDPAIATLSFGGIVYMDDPSTAWAPR